MLDPVPFTRSGVDPVSSLENRRLILLGAGASVEAGLPTSRMLDAQLRSSNPVYTAISSLLAEAGLVDFERAVRLLRFLADLDEPASLSSDVSLMLEGTLQEQVLRLAQVPLSKKNLAAEAGDELTRIMGNIRTSLWIDPSEADRVTYLAALVQAQFGSTIATLNYDNTIELAGGIDHPAIKTSGDHHVGVPPRGPNHVRLLKLHGSSDWRFYREAVMAGGDPMGLVEYEPAVVIGTGNKLRHYGPFLEIYRTFRSSMEVADQLIIIGYGFGDAHINFVLDQVIRERGISGNGLRLDVCLGPGRSRPPDLVSEWETIADVRLHAMPASSLIRHLFPTAGKLLSPDTRANPSATQQSLDL